MAGVEIVAPLVSKDCGGTILCERSGTGAGPLIELDTSTEDEEIGTARSVAVTGNTGGLTSERVEIGDTGATATGLVSADCGCASFTGGLSDPLILANTTNTPDRFSTVNTPHRFGEFSPPNRI